MIKALNIPLTLEEIYQAISQNSDSMNKFLSTGKHFINDGKNSLVNTLTFEESMPVGGDKPQDFQRFEILYGVPLSIGLLVTISPEHRYYKENPGVLIVSGIDCGIKKTFVTTTERWDGERVDRWSPDDLVLATT